MPEAPHQRREELRRRLLRLGFDTVRFARAEAVMGPQLRAWLDAGHHADMSWIERAAEKRGDPRLVLPGARTVIMLGVNYGPVAARSDGGPVWARYALHADYHDTIKPGLVAAGRVVEELFGATSDDYRYYVDTGPVQERGWATRAGLGFTGKNAMLISREHGNWLFLATILLRAEIAPDGPLLDSLAGRDDLGAPGLLCGKCTRCIDACPTDAIVAPGTVDARRCVSYQTIENKGVIPRELRAGIGDRIYGCDVCLEVCPWNRFARDARSVLLTARGEIRELTLRALLELTPERFAEVFRKTAIKRVKLAGLLRNACIVAGNTGATECLDILVRLAAEAAPLVRAHAVWAVARLGALDRLSAVRAAETDPAVLAEYAAEFVT
ncbi:MAG: tRNA epoxyqueuosine(34) reductase QueG [Verrucomicrobiota bacterium]